MKPPPSIPGRIRRALRLVGWNVLFLVAGLALIGVVGEAYLRLTVPFVESDLPYAWSPTAGMIFTPNAEVRHTNGLDFWTISRTNSLGFPDREPVGLERAAASCHVAMIGDSYVEALQVPIADKFHVRLEALAAEEYAIWTSRPRRSGSAAPAKSTNWRTMTNSRGICAPLCWCSSLLTTTS